MNRFWMRYPRTVRTFYKLNAQTVGGFALVIIGAVLVELFVQWLMHR